MTTAVDLIDGVSISIIVTFSNEYNVDFWNLFKVGTGD